MWAYLAEAPLMLPFAFSAFLIPHRLEKGGAVADGSVNSSGGNHLVEQAASPSSQLPKPRAAPTFCSQVSACLREPIYVSVCLGYAAFTAVTAGLAFYGPIFIQTNRPCDSAWRFKESTADYIFGGVVCSGGLIGTTIGGKLLDTAGAKAGPTTLRNRLVVCSSQITMQMLLGGGLAIIATFMKSPVLFFTFLWLGCTIIFSTTAGTNLIINWSVPIENRAMAVALSIMCIHALGDVPSPVVIGAIADHAAPSQTLLVTMLWIGWAVVFWGGCWILARRLPPA